MKTDRYELIGTAYTLAKENPDKTVYYVTSKIRQIALYIKCAYIHFPKNICIINYGAFMNHARGKNYLAVVDNLDRWLELMNIKDYTMSEGEKNDS